MIYSNTRPRFVYIPSRRNIESGIYFSVGDLCSADPLLVPRPRRNEGVTLPLHRGIPIYNVERIPDGGSGSIVLTEALQKVLCFEETCLARPASRESSRDFEASWGAQCTFKRGNRSPRRFMTRRIAFLSIERVPLTEFIFVQLISRNKTNWFILLCKNSIGSVNYSYIRTMQGCRED